MFPSFNLSRWVTRYISAQYLCLLYWMFFYVFCGYNLLKILLMEIYDYESLLVAVSDFAYLISRIEVSEARMVSPIERVCLN